MVNHNQSGFEEIIKCVMVGDSGVGKTCLICAFASNAKYSLHKLVKTHQATVWAIDHYNNDQEVSEGSLYISPIYNSITLIMNNTIQSKYNKSVNTICTINNILIYKYTIYNN